MLACPGDSAVRRHGSVLLFVLTQEPHVVYPDKRTVMKHFVRPHSGSISHQPVGQSQLLDTDVVLPKVHYLVTKKLNVPFYCSTFHNDSDMLLTRRSCVSKLFPFMNASACALGEREITSPGDEASSKVQDLLKQEGGCAEQIHALLKMMWTACAAGGQTKVQFDVDYSEHFSSFMTMNEREKLFYRCSIKELFIKHILRDLENSTNLKDVKYYLCLLENYLCIQLDASSSELCNLPLELFVCDTWWSALGRHLRKEPTTSVELQVFNHVVIVVTRICQVNNWSYYCKRVYKMSLKYCTVCLNTSFESFSTFSIRLFSFL